MEPCAPIRLRMSAVPRRQSRAFRQEKSMSFRPVRTVLAAALALAAVPAAAQTYSQTVFFGDSLTDAGYFRPLLPPQVQPVTGQFTTNPGLVWSQYLADFYGTSAVPNG